MRGPNKLPVILYHEILCFVVIGFVHSALEVSILKVENLSFDEQNILEIILSAV